MDELIIKSEKTLSTIGKIGMDTVIKPLTKEIWLKDCFVKGLIFDSEIKIAKLKVGDALTIRREKLPYDDLCVAIYDNEVRLGELADYEEGIFARLLDAGKKLVAKVKNVVIMPLYNSLEISISLIDY